MISIRNYIISAIIYMNWNHYIEELKGYISKIKNIKISFKEIEIVISKFDGIAHSKVHISLYDKIFQIFL